MIALIAYIIFYTSKKNPLELSPENKNQLAILMKKEISTAEEIFRRAEKRSELGDFKGSIEDFNQPFKLNPNLSDLNFKRGLAKFKLAEIQWCPSPSNIDVKNSEKYKKNQVIDQKVLDYEAIIKDFDLTIQLNSKNALAYMYKGVCKSRIRLDRDALEDYNKSILLDPKNSLAYVYRGLTRYTLDDFVGEIKDYKRASEIDPSNSLALFYLGYKEYEYQRHKAVLVYFDKVIKLDPNFAKAYFYRGTSRLLLGDTNGQKDDLKKYKELIAE